MVDINVGGPSGFALLALSWILTYAIHSTLLLGAAWWLSRRLITSHGVRDLVWKAALIGGVLTASAQQLAGFEPISGRMAVSVPAPRDPAPVYDSRPDDRSAVTPKVKDRPASEAAAPFISAEPASVAGENSAAAEPVAQPSKSLVFYAAAAALSIWALVAAALVLHYTLARYRLAGLLGRRQPVTDQHLTGLLATLKEATGIRRPIRLSFVEGLASPVALGANEICVPEAAMVELDPEQQRGMLAHELAHLARRDPAWLALACLIERVLFFQPLNQMARRRLQEAAEYLCDDWAVRRTGSGLTLARCLVKVAEWMDTAPRPVPVTGMAELRSQFVSRIHRLVENRAMAPEPARPWLVPAAVILLSATAGAAPTITLVRNAPPQAGSEARADLGEGSELAGRAPESTRTQRRFVQETARTTTESERERRSEAALPPAIAQSLMAQDTSRAVAALIVALKDTDVDVRRAAAQSLARLKDPAAVQPLIDVLNDEDADVRRNAAEALGELGDVRAVDPLIARLKDESADVRSRSAEALGQLEDRRAAPALATAITDPSPEVRRNAIDALDDMKFSGAVDAFIGALKDSDADVRQAAAQALGQREDRRAVRPLVGALADASADVRHNVAHALGDLRDPSAADALAAALKDTNADVRQAAAEALSQLELPTAPPALLDALNDPNADVRQAAANAVGEIHDSRAVPALVKLLDDGDADVRENAIEALSEIRDSVALRALIGALKSSDSNVRKHAAEALGQRN